MNQLRIETPEDRDCFEPADEIELELSWELSERPESIELRVVWNTQGKGTTDLGVAQTHPIEAWDTMGTRRVSITLPRSPYSFSGQLISLVWALELVALPSKASTRREITIAPAGREIRLAKQVDELMS